MSSLLRTIFVICIIAAVVIFLIHIIKTLAYGYRVSKNFPEEIKKTRELFDKQKSTIRGLLETNDKIITESHKTIEQMNGRISELSNENAMLKEQLEMYNNFTEHMANEWHDFSRAFTTDDIEFKEKWISRFVQEWNRHMDEIEKDISRKNGEREGDDR